MKRISIMLGLLLICMTGTHPFTLNGEAVEESLPPTMQVRLLETTDLHAHMMDDLYDKREPTVEYGLVRTASLIKQARREVPNTLLFDNGDLLQGNALADYVATKKGLAPGEVHPVYQAMNLLKYDAATFGNHEFNYGLEFLNDAIEEANFPYVNANIYVNDRNSLDIDDINYYNPYIILKRTMIDSNGKKHKLKIGVLGLVTPLIMYWDKGKLIGKIKVKNIAKTAENFIPIMKQKGADIIIALAHSGLESGISANNNIENTIYPLSKVEGIDAILYGHTHHIFPDENRTFTVDGVDTRKGTINGVQAVQAGRWGSHLGIIDLQLEKINGKWKVVNSQSFTRAISKKIKGKSYPLVKPNQTIVNAVKHIHRETLQYLKEKGRAR
ncbi:metallophosphoesterase [Bacillus massilinigeriensis]|uniref:metallophosphoesterase n=1 Tax=Bacillus massilionigeriensis TaxID=1805475 RepID=UPI001F24B147|nr:metallophosphoesterase [Bacillus massilionigeriensis]